MDRMDAMKVFARTVQVECVVVYMLMKDIRQEFLGTLMLRR